MAEEKIIVRVDIDKKAAGQRLVDLEKDIVNYRTELRELNKALKDGEISQTNYAKRVLENRAGMKEAREEQKALTAAMQAEAGSIDSLKVKMAQLIKTRNATNQSTAEGVQAASKLDKQILALNQRISQNEEASGTFSRSVGRYKDDIIAAADSTSLFGINLGQVRQGFLTANSAILTTNKTLNLLKIALISTGIGAIVVLLGTLISYFTNTARGADKFGKVLAGIGATVDVLKDRFSLFGEGLVQLFSGNFADAVTSFRASTSGIMDEIIDESQKAYDLEERKQQLERKRIAFLVEEQKLLQQLEKVRTLGEDKSRTTAEQEANTTAAMKLQNQLTEKRIAMKEEEIAILKAQQALGENMIEDDRELAQAEADLLGIRNQSEELSRTLNNQLNEIRASGVAKAKQAENELLALQKKNAKEQQEIEKQRLAIKIVGLEEEINKERENIDKKLALNKELVDAKLQQQLIGIQAGTDLELVAIREANLEKLKLEQEFLDAKAEQQREFEIMIAEDIEQFNKDTTDKVRESVNTRIAEEKRQGKVAQEQEQAKRDLVFITADAVEGTAKEGTALAKTAGVTKTLVNTYEGAVGAYNSAQVLPFPLSQILGIAAALAITTFGLKQAGKIAGLAKGGLVDGPGTATSDSIPVFLSRGESVINAASTKMFAPQLSAMNVAGGGRPFNMPNLNRGYAMGGIIAAEHSTNEQINQQLSLQRILENLPPTILDIQEFTKANKRFENKVHITSI